MNDSYFLLEKHASVPNGKSQCTNNFGSCSPATIEKDKMFSSSYLLALVRPSTWELQLEPEQSTFASNSAWSNKDMDPVPPYLRTWTTLSYITFWISCAANDCPGGGALLAVSSGHLIIAIIIVLNGTIGVRLRVPFPVINRSSFGFWLSYFSVISLIVLSMFWFGVQTFIGSECVYQMLKALWPSITHLPNHLPPDAKITSLPFMFVSPHKIRWLFLAKTIVVPPTLLTLLIWAAMKARASHLRLSWWMGAFCPWKVLASKVLSATLLSIGLYTARGSTFLQCIGPMEGIAIYTYGVNWRAAAAAAMLVSIPPTFPWSRT
ncbi:permease for cytosine/purines, uracil, thiamine, allantoin-domain-containing protein [Lactarius vividus]|nr:permease for cytosine/purines, uracil, thiamine, allantoin-domain-containing protein [Lactarius vividus]